VPYERRGSSGYALRLSTSTVLLDCGSGTTWKLEKVGINYLEIDHIFISHRHPDHTADLVPFLFATRYASKLERRTPLIIYGGKGFEDFFLALQEAYKDWIVPSSLQIREIEEGILKFEDFTVTAKETLHMEGSLAYRIESEGKSLVYSGDTDYSDSLIELSKDADVLVIECSFPDEESKVKGHLTPREVGKIAKEAGVKKLVITHLYPICDEVDVIGALKDKYKGEVVIAEDLLELEI